MTFIAVAVFAIAERRVLSGEALGLVGAGVVVAVFFATHQVSRSLRLAFASGFSVGCAWGSVQLFAIAEFVRDSEGDLGDAAVGLLLVGAAGIMVLAAMLVGLPVSKVLLENDN